MVNVATPVFVVNTSTSGLANVKVLKSIVAAEPCAILTVGEVKPAKEPPSSATTPALVVRMRAVVDQLSFPPVTPIVPTMYGLANTFGENARAAANASKTTENFFIHTSEIAS
jgi:hypothetical protein